jgi:membrane-associated phospholipid phosphatase
MRDTKIGWVATLVVLAFVQAAAFVEVWRFFVGTGRGQALDTISLTGNTIGQARIDGLVGTVLNAISVLSLAVATAVIVFIALIRRRVAVAVVAAGLIAAANVTAQLLKYGLDRPALGVDRYRSLAENSLPSGHTAVAASVAVALVLVLPPTVRGWGGLVATGYAALVGVATLSAGWHRPSDAVAALLLVGAWSAVAGVVLLLAQRSAGGSVDKAHWLVAGVLVVAGFGLLVVAAVAFGLTEQVAAVPPTELSRRRLFAAYAGGAAGIAGIASLVMAAVLGSVHQVVPARSD